MAEVSDSTISPKSEEPKQGSSYGYPGERNGASGADFKPKSGSPVNGKSAK